MKLTEAQTAPVQAAAKQALEFMEGERARKGKPAAIGFATLEDPDSKETVGLVLVCLEPTQVGPLIEYIHALGNFRMLGGRHADT